MWGIPHIKGAPSREGPCPQRQVHSATAPDPQGTPCDLVGSGTAFRGKCHPCSWRGHVTRPPEFCEFLTDPFLLWLGIFTAGSSPNFSPSLSSWAYWLAGGVFLCHVAECGAFCAEVGMHCDEGGNAAPPPASCLHLPHSPCQPYLPVLSFCISLYWQLQARLLVFTWSSRRRCDCFVLLFAPWVMAAAPELRGGR